MRIGIDAMGGDFAPETVVLGAIDALKDIASGSRIVLYGDQAQIESILSREGVSPSAFDIVATTQVIEMGDQPAQAFLKKPDSSIAVGFNDLAAGKIDGFSSAGSTGAMMVGSVYTVKQIDGVIRPTISSAIPTYSGSEVLILDVGLNVDCKPEVLLQYAQIGDMYAKSVLGIESPRVALLNIGEEREKGNALTKAAHELMEAEDSGFNFVGNIEAKYVLSGKVADVVVCDGFVGNSLIKQIEGFYEIAMNDGIKNSYFNKLNYETIGGTPVLGINSTVLIGHGCSSALAIKNMILQTQKTVKADLVNKLKEIFK